MAPFTPWHRSPASLTSKGRLMPSAPGLQCPRGERSLPEPCVQAAPHHMSLFSSSLPGLSSRYLGLNPRETQPPTEANVRASLMAAELALHPSTASWPQLREMLLQGTHEHPQPTTHLPEPQQFGKEQTCYFRLLADLQGVQIHTVAPTFKSHQRQTQRLGRPHLPPWPQPTRATGDQTRISQCPEAIAEVKKRTRNSQRSNLMQTSATPIPSAIFPKHKATQP